MPKYIVAVNITSKKELNIYASDEDLAEEKACDIVLSWDNVEDCEVVEVEEVL